MNKEFIPYEQALELKELGFNEECLATYIKHPNKDVRFDIQEQSGICWYTVKNTDFDGEHCTIPLYQQAFRWFREKHNILATVYSNASSYLYEWHDAVGGTHIGWSEYEGTNDSGVWDSYEEAELARLKKLIEIVKNK